MAKRREKEVLEGVECLKCTKCSTVLPLHSFNTREPYKDGTVRYRSKCITCEKKISLSKYYSCYKGEAHRLSSYKYTLKTKYNLTVEEYQALQEAAGGKCQICAVQLENIFQQIIGVHAAVDHCHTTGKVRGLLCRKCNSGIGMLKDDVALLDKALRYLNDNNHR